MPDSGSMNPIREIGIWGSAGPVTIGPVTPLAGDGFAPCIERIEAAE